MAPYAGFLEQKSPTDQLSLPVLVRPCSQSQTVFEKCHWDGLYSWKPVLAGRKTKKKKRKLKKLQTWRELWSLVKYLWIRHCKWHHFNQLVISTIVNMKYIVWCNFKFSLDHLYCEECSIYRLFGLLINICNWIAIPATPLMYTTFSFWFYYLYLM